jgi:hypothetical protein
MALPIKKVVLDNADASCGLKTISFVADPAIEINFLKFDKDKEFKLAIQNEEKRIVFSPALIPNQLIYRKVTNQANGLTEEFNIFFDADTIMQIAVKATKDKIFTNADVEHSGVNIDGIVWFEQVVLSKDRFPAAKGFEGLPEGTLMMTGKVENDEVWAKIKSGEIRGVSIDGLFNAVPIKQSNQKIEFSENELKDICSHLVSVGIV